MQLSSNLAHHSSDPTPYTPSTHWTGLWRLHCCLSFTFGDSFFSYKSLKCWCSVISFMVLIIMPLKKIKQNKKTFPISQTPTIKIFSSCFLISMKNIFVTFRSVSDLSMCVPSQLCHFPQWSTTQIANRLNFYMCVAACRWVRIMFICLNKTEMPFFFLMLPRQVV